MLSLARDERLRCWSHIDERSAAFFALGIAKASGVPAAIACTSGTAAANYMPAVVEASEARTPLIVLTADRPPELREVGAGQAIDQLKLFGAFTRWFFEVGSHRATPERLRWIRGLACRAFATATGERPGPVHLNFPLREPLVLEEPLPVDDSGRPDGRPMVVNMRSRGDASPVATAARGSERVIVVAGRLERGGNRLGEAAASLAAPLLADPLSGLRTGPAAIAHYDALLRDEDFAARSRPDLVVRIGDLPTSKPLRSWLATLDCEQIAIDPEGAWQDPDMVVSRRINADAGDALAAVAGARAPADWLSHWRTADEQAKRALAQVLGDELSDPAVATDLATLVPSGGALFVASSMPIRDIETFFPVLDSPPRVLSNRGANGIDGTVAAALGVAATGIPTTLLIGDVALAHDLGSLGSVRRLELPLLIVLVDNGGGAIFDFLPVSSQRDAFEEHVATPTGMDVPAVAALFGLEYRPVSARSEFANATRGPLPALIHVQSDRARNVELHRACWAAVAGL